MSLSRTEATKDSRTHKHTYTNTSSLTHTVTNSPLAKEMGSRTDTHNLTSVNINKGCQTIECTIALSNFNSKNKLQIVHALFMLTKL